MKNGKDDIDELYLELIIKFEESKEILSNFFYYFNKFNIIFCCRHKKKKKQNTCVNIFGDLNSKFIFFKFSHILGFEKNESLKEFKLGQTVAPMRLRKEQIKQAFEKKD